jgi:hypothetical protein
MVACIDFFEMSEICRPKFIVPHSIKGFSSVTLYNYKTIKLLFLQLPQNKVPIQNFAFFQFLNSSCVRKPYFFMMMFLKSFYGEETEKRNRDAELKIEP